MKVTLDYGYKRMYLSYQPEDGALVSLGEIDLLTEGEVKQNSGTPFFVVFSVDQARNLVKMLNETIKEYEDKEEKYKDWK